LGEDDYYKILESKSRKSFGYGEKSLTCIQMRLTERGAHLLLQVRTRVLNEDWRSTFSRWYPGIEKTGDAKAA
jgi:hypothetical protein